MVKIFFDLEEKDIMPLVEPTEELIKAIRKLLGQ